MIQSLQQTIFRNQVNHIIERNKQTLQINSIGQANPERINKLLNIIREGEMPMANKKQIINSFTQPYQLLKYSVMPFIEKIISQITIQYMDLSLKVNPLTMNEYLLPNGKQIVSFFKDLIHISNLQRIDKLLQMLKANEDQYKFYYIKIVEKMILKSKQIILGMNYCITQQSVFNLLFMDNNFDTSILTSRLLTEQNQITIKKKLSILEYMYPRVEVDVVGIKIQHIIQHNAKFAEYMLTPKRNQNIFSIMNPQQDFNPSKQVLIQYLKNLNVEQYFDMVPQDQQLKQEMLQELKNPYAS